MTVCILLSVCFGALCPFDTPIIMFYSLLYQTRRKNLLVYKGLKQCYCNMFWITVNTILKRNISRCKSVKMTLTSIALCFLDMIAKLELTFSNAQQNKDQADPSPHTHKTQHMSNNEQLFNINRTIAQNHRSRTESSRSHRGGGGEGIN